MSAFFIVHRQSITNPNRLKEYRDGIGATISRYGGHVLVRADGFDVMEGDWHSGERGDDSEPERVTVIQFPDMASLKQWYASPEYAPLKEIRLSSTVGDAIAVEIGTDTMNPISMDLASFSLGADGRWAEPWMPR